MHKVTLEEASLNLPQLIEEAARGGDVVIVRDQHPVARIIAVESPAAGVRTFGSARGKITMADDFDAPLDDFKEYMV